MRIIFLFNTFVAIPSLLVLLRPIMFKSQSAKFNRNSKFWFGTLTLTSISYFLLSIGDEVVRIWGYVLLVLVITTCIYEIVKVIEKKFIQL